MQVSEELNLINQRLQKQLRSYQTKYKESVFEAMQYSLLASGKRIRPLLCVQFNKLCGGEIQDALPFACAVEMVHCYSLIHDDLPCMDNDDMRRGKPTNHKVFGEDIALIAGDGLLNMAFETMLGAEISSDKVVKASKSLGKYAGVYGMIGGQCIDLQSEGKRLSLEQLTAMNMGKTVAIIKSACEMGVIVAGGTQLQIESAKKYAENIGMAFQIRDDILDLIGDEKELGKKVGMDKKLEKCNFLSLLGLEKSQELVEEYTQKAIEVLDNFSGDTKFLKDFAIEMKLRKK